MIRRSNMRKICKDRKVGIHKNTSNYLVLVLLVYTSLTGMRLLSESIFNLINPLERNREIANSLSITTGLIAYVSDLIKYPVLLFQDLAVETFGQDIGHIVLIILSLFIISISLHLLLRFTQRIRRHLSLSF